MRKFRVFNLNCLAPSLVDFKYSHIRRGVLNWRDRGRRILEAIKKSDADFVTLQEVEDFEWFYDYLGPTYEGHFVKASGDGQNHGIAIFVARSSYWRTEHVHQVSYYHGDGSILKSFHGGLIVVVRADTVNHSEHLIIMTTHLVFNMNRGDQKMCQLLKLLWMAEGIKQQLLDRGASAVHLVFAGDLNMTPQGTLYEFISSGRIPFADLDACHSHFLSGQWCLERLILGPRSNDTGSLVHVQGYDSSGKKSTSPLSATIKRFGLEMKELYPSVPFASLKESVDIPERLRSGFLAVTRGGVRTEPLTVYHGWQKGCVDYIWHSEGLMVVDAYIPKSSAIQEAGDMPNWAFPLSDHVWMSIDLQASR